MKRPNQTAFERTSPSNSFQQHRTTRRFNNFYHSNVELRTGFYRKPYFNNWNASHFHYNAYNRGFEWNDYVRHHNASDWFGDYNVYMSAAKTHAPLAQKKSVYRWTLKTGAANPKGPILQWVPKSV